MNEYKEVLKLLKLANKRHIRLILIYLKRLLRAD